MTRKLNKEKRGGETMEALLAMWAAPLIIVGIINFLLT